MERHGAQRPVSHRAAALTVATLVLLAVLTGAVATPTAVGHHHRTHVLVAATAGADVQSLPSRSGIDAVPARDSAAELAAIRLAESTQSAAAPAATEVETLRSRGPPATAL